MSPRAGLVAGLFFVLFAAACGGGEPPADAAAVDLGVDSPLDLGADLAREDGGDVSGCIVECVAIRPGEYRSECHAVAGGSCDGTAYAICDRDAAPEDLRDGGLYLAPLCVRPQDGGAADRVAACGVDPRGIATVTGPPVVVCVTSN